MIHAQTSAKNCKNSQNITLLKLSMCKLNVANTNLDTSLKF